MQKFRDSMENLYERAREGLSTEELKALSGLTELAGDEARRLSEVCSYLGCMIDTEGRSEGPRTGYFQESESVSTLLFTLAHGLETISTMASIGDSATYHLHERMAKHGEVMP